VIWLLPAVHIGVSAIWLGAMGDSPFVVPPRLARSSPAEPAWYARSESVYPGPRPGRYTGQMPDPADHARNRPRSRPLLRSALGEALRRARLEQGRTLADVAVAARISLPYLSEVERGRKEVSSEVLAALCDALGVDLSDLLIRVVFRLSADSVASPGIGRAAGSSPGNPAGGTGGIAAPPARHAGDAYALAA
jgi:DNA-binding Xre family transcriptional regulator